MNKKHIVDLSHKLTPGKEHNFKFEVQNFEAKEYIPSLVYDDDIWYIISQVDLCTHCGTHIEMPFHHVKGGADTASFPLHKLVGNLVVLDFRGKKNLEAITLDELKAYDAEIEEGDIVFLHTGFDKGFHSEKWDESCFIAQDGIEWLVEKKIACIGTDGPFIESDYVRNQPGHISLLEANIPIVESLTNLEQVESGKYIVFILPMAVENLEACPTRIVAVSKEGLGELSRM